MPDRRRLHRVFISGWDGDTPERSDGLQSSRGWHSSAASLERARFAQPANRCCCPAALARHVIILAAALIYILPRQSHRICRAASPEPLARVPGSSNRGKLMAQAEHEDRRVIMTATLADESTRRHHQRPQRTAFRLLPSIFPLPPDDGREPNYWRTVWERLLLDPPPGRPSATRTVCAGPAHPAIAQIVDLQCFCDTLPPPARTRRQRSDPILPRSSARGEP